MPKDPCGDSGRLWGNELPLTTLRWQLIADRNE